MSGPDVTEKLRKAREVKEANKVTDDNAVQAPVSDQTATPAEAATAPAKEKRKKDPVPEGKMVPVEFAKHLTKVLRETDPTADEVRPQVVYGYTKSMKGFDQFVSMHTDNRPLIDVEGATQFLVERRTRRAAEKAAKAQAATPAETAAS
jgi:hypothetical protein